MRVAVITISDRASRGEYDDLSGPEIEHLLGERFPSIEIERTVVPDEPDEIRAALDAAAGVAAAGNRGPADFIFTTGGTGISPRDVTPEVTRAWCDKELPGIAETLRAESLKETPAAMLSRGYAGLKGGTVVINFPGSLKAVRLCVRVVAPAMEHAMKMVRGEGH